MLSENKKAPAFKLKNQNDETISLSDFKGKKVIIYFYPKDNTPGCTKEACSLRDSNKKISDKNAIVLGISPDTVQSHAKFIEKLNLPFHLLSDPEHKVAELYEAWGEKKMYGKTYLGILRSTYIIDEKGIIIKTFPKVKVATHGEDILEFL